MSFNVTEFLETELSLPDVNDLVKAQLIDVANFLELEFDSRSKKVLIKELVVAELVSRGKLPTSVMEGLQQSVKHSPEFETQMLQMKQHDLDLKYQNEREQREHRLRELEFEMRHRELEIKNRELDLEMKRLDVQKSPQSSVQNSSPVFDVSRNIRMVPKFNEKEVEKFFLHFEKVAISLKWPSDMWSVLVQSVLSGKAQEIYSALTVAQCSDYEVMKGYILKSYELVPEAYRQKFRNYQKFGQQTNLCRICTTKTTVL